MCSEDLTHLSETSQTFTSRKYKPNPTKLSLNIAVIPSEENMISECPPNVQHGQYFLMFYKCLVNIPFDPFANITFPCSLNI